MKTNQLVVTNKRAYMQPRTGVAQPETEAVMTATSWQGNENDPRLPIIEGDPDGDGKGAKRRGGSDYDLWDETDKLW